MLKPTAVLSTVVILGGGGALFATSSVGLTGDNNAAGTQYNQVCVEDGLQTLSLDPLASGTVHDTGEPLVGGINPNLGNLVHQVNCQVVVPTEDLVDELLAGGG